MLRLCLFLLLVPSFRVADGAKILATMIVPSRSHHLWNMKYFEALADRGHMITYFGVDEYKNPHKNIRHILAEGVYEAVYSSIDMNAIGLTESYGSIKTLNIWDNITVDAVAKSNGFKKLVEVIKTEKFDLVIHDLGNGAFMAGVLGPLNYPPIIGVTAFGVPPWALKSAGNPIPYTDSPHFFMPYTNQMTYLERLDNFLLHLYTDYEYHKNMKIQNEYSKQGFGATTKNLEDIFNNMNIVLVNWNPATDFPFPSVPGLISIAGLQIQETKPLPKDLQDFLDNAKDGVVYFSLGSNVQSSLLNAEKINIFKKAFEKIAPVKVLWKWETDTLPGKPANVETRKWLPQNDVLAHPNVKMFFTHGGLFGTQEAMYHGVPVLGMPFFLDQHVNVDKYVRRDIGEKLNFDTITVDSLYNSLRKILDDPKYSKNMKHLSGVFKDSMNKPLDTAIFWTEYAIRHKGAAHLRPASRDLSWYQTSLLDILAVVIGVPLICLYFVFKLLTSISSKSSDKQQKKKTH